MRCYTIVGGKALHKFLILGCLGLLLVTGTRAVSATTDCELPYSRQIVDAILNADYPLAHRLRQNWHQREPDSWHPGFYHAGILLAQVPDARGDAVDVLRDNALRLLDKVQSGLLAQQNRSPEDQLILGMAEAFAARIHLDRESWIKAYSTGRRARDRLRRLIADHPDTEDAYLVLGLYEFYTGDVPRGLKWLTYVLDLSGERKLGLQWLERTAANATTASPEAARVLLDELELEAPEICQWLSLNEQLREKYPDSSRIAWLLQRNYRLCGLPEKALEDNRAAYRTFRGNRKTQTRLLSQRLLIFRDLGDTDMMERYRKRFRPDFYADRLAEAEAVKNRQSSVYQPPSPVRNDRGVRIHSGCSD